MTPVDSQPGSPLYLSGLASLNDDFSCLSPPNKSSASLPGLPEEDFPGTPSYQNKRSQLKHPIYPKEAPILGAINNYDKKEPLTSQTEIFQAERRGEEHLIKTDKKNVMWNKVVYETLTTTYSLTPVSLAVTNKIALLVQVTFEINSAYRIGFPRVDRAVINICTIKQERLFRAQLKEESIIYLLTPKKDFPKKLEGLFNQVAEKEFPEIIRKQKSKQKEIQNGYKNYKPKEDNLLRREEVKYS